MMSIIMAKDSIFYDRYVDKGPLIVSHVIDRWLPKSISVNLHKGSCAKVRSSEFHTDELYKKEAEKKKKKKKVKLRR